MHGAVPLLSPKPSTRPVYQLFTSSHCAAHCLWRRDEEAKLYLFNPPRAVLVGYNNPDAPLLDTRAVIVSACTRAPLYARAEQWAHGRAGCGRGAGATIVYASAVHVHVHVDGAWSSAASVANP